MTSIYVDVDLSEFRDDDIADYVARNDELFNKVLIEREKRKKFAEIADYRLVEEKWTEWHHLHGVTA